jgi:hypothetical protein
MATTSATSAFQMNAPETVLTDAARTVVVEGDDGVPGRHVVVDDDVGDLGEALAAAAVRGACPA